ncbi:5-formyltetrahydrofolate cyclo-ligase [Bacillus sp. HMF5848]|uniref:5-formyltetrahydrofolate cyclo-ligase n=1 Tax=Bacillus sp. HMF5848 TaxID=2495421 RepID=UPI000F7878D0|nr:5-formyltetrahydrofolate cyclo-ligase [Bacillus sp. HMF5848]RSK27848.1 5-formyltetrahydrofolate cyclo-ligase [Bacillus sp. HMF5848]
MNKGEIRKQMKQELSQLSEAKREEMSKSIYNKLFSSSLWREADTIGITIAMPFEINTKPIIKKAWDEQKQVLVPKCIPSKRILDYYELTDFNQLETVYYNLQEPNVHKAKKNSADACSLLFVPGLAFNIEGYRIGFGGGYFDRLLASYKGGPTIALAYKLQIISNIPHSSFDMRVNHILTEDSNIMSCK